MQYTALMGTEEVEVTFSEDGIAALAKIAADVNQSVENIGARRLYTVLERVFEELVVHSARQVRRQRNRG